MELTAKEMLVFTEASARLLMGSNNIGKVSDIIDAFETGQIGPDLAVRKIDAKLSALSDLEKDYALVAALLERSPDLLESIRLAVQMYGTTVGLKEQFIAERSRLMAPEKKLGLKFSKSVDAEALVWLVTALEHKGWLLRAPTDVEMNELFQVEGRDKPYSAKTFKDISVKKYLPGAAENDDLDQEKQKLFRAFLTSFPRPI